MAQPTGTAGSQLVAHFGEVGAAICALLSNAETASDVAGIPADALTVLVTSLLSSGGAAASAATVLTGHVDAGSGRATGTLVAGKYTCTRRFLEVEGGLSQRSATAMVARARDLRRDFTSVAGPWLGGRLSCDAVDTMPARRRRAGPGWTTGVFGREDAAWVGLCWGGAEPQDPARV